MRQFYRFTKYNSMTLYLHGFRIITKEKKSTIDVRIATTANNRRKTLLKCNCIKTSKALTIHLIHNMLYYIILRLPCTTA